LASAAIPASTSIENTITTFPPSCEIIKVRVYVI
jgi:hypothetical protein